MKMMDHTVREMALLGAFVGLLGVGAAILKADLPANWLRTKFDGGGRTDPTLPAPVMLLKPKEPIGTRSKDHDEATLPVESVESVRSDANEEFPVRDEFTPWVTTPAVGITLTR